MKTESVFLGGENGAPARDANKLVSAVALPCAVLPPWLREGVDIAILLLADIVALLMATIVGYVVWVGPMLQQSASTYVNLAPLLWLFPLGYAGAGLYPGFGVGAVETL